jgi:hypothetical protein
VRFQDVHVELLDGPRLMAVALSVDWDNATVSPTATGLLWIEVAFGPVPDGAELRLLSQALNELSEESGLVEGAHLKGNLIRLHIAPDADVPATKRALAGKLDEYNDQADERLRAAQARSAEIEAKRAKAEAAASEVRAQLRDAHA